MTDAIAATLAATGVAPFALATIVKTPLAFALVGAAWSALDRAPCL